MNEYYKDRLEVGLQFQDFVTDILFTELFIPLSSYQSKKYQLKGENKQGVEIKFDDKFKDSGNLYIEIAEKSNPNNPTFIDSGIYRNDNTWLYIIGNYQILFIFGKSTLKLLHKDKRYRSIEIPTSKGFLIPRTDAVKFALKVINI